MARGVREVWFGPDSTFGTVPEHPPTGGAGASLGIQCGRSVAEPRPGGISMPVGDPRDIGSVSGTQGSTLVALCRPLFDVVVLTAGMRE